MAAFDIFANSPQTQCSGVSMTDDGYNLATDTSCDLTGTGSLQGSAENPELAPLAQNGSGGPPTMSILSAASPAINIEIPATTCDDVHGVAVTSDEVGQVRPSTIIGGTSGCDAGAYQGITVSVSSVSPKSGPVAGGTAITITGTGFVPGASVVIGQGRGVSPSDIPAVDVIVVSSTEITAQTGAANEPGHFNVFVITPGGASVGNSGDQYSYLEVCGPNGDSPDC